jgi:hypothetical protein
MGTDPSVSLMTDFPTINRHAAVLIPTETCLDWVKSCPEFVDESPLGQAECEPTIYLVPDDPVEDSIRRHYRAIFKEELSSWYTDPNMWPSDLSFDNFKRFFTIHTTTMVYDLGKGKIERDEG